MLEKLIFSLLLFIFQVHAFAQLNLCQKLDSVLADAKNNFQLFSRSQPGGLDTGTAHFKGALSELVEEVVYNKMKKDYVIVFFVGTSNAADSVCTVIKNSIDKCVLKNYNYTLHPILDGVFRYEFVNKEYEADPGHFANGIFEIALWTMFEKLGSNRYRAVLRIINR